MQKLKVVAVASLMFSSAPALAKKEVPPPAIVIIAPDGKGKRAGPEDNLTCAVLVQGSQISNLTCDWSQYKKGKK